MHEISREALTGSTPEQVFDLVAAVEDYPFFLRGCGGAQIHRQDENEVLASLDLRGGVFKQRLTTLNRMRRPHRLEMNLSDGPFRHLSGSWRFEPVGGGCRVSLNIRFEFESRAQELLLGRSFEALCDRLVVDFLNRVRRAA
ncbi:MAG: type II toxin-antitoxin system RatA family toxin [Gammaproteobacteria bacterium]|nr:type II toxin-antitoxin system RatA family toxin [Gammaproteobacteria bacterium]MCY4164889.1 type II toxin-antitoxin system RatA family toxin [Gammaproteobacteria bacterium]MCY4255339.1 type II toxin-antitoxin system RatA family toxin [Gammaproteobacteria bacterium]MCY4340516.1 type II toxin-antitoxin system RatA family toxin [Gammaproteobacteria bacterium]